MRLGQKYYKKEYDNLCSKQDTTPEVLSIRDALEDLEQCIYLLSTSCASFVEQYNSIIFKIKLLRIKRTICSLESITTVDFLMNILGKITNNILDRHSYYIWNHNDKIHNYTYSKFFGTGYIGYFSELKFVKKGIHYCAINNSNIRIIGKCLSKKTKIKKNKLYLIPVIDKNKIIYRAVKYLPTSSQQNGNLINEKNSIICYRLHNQIENTISYFEKIFNLKSESFYLRFPDFEDPKKDCIYQKYERNISELRNKKNIIIDNRNNLGGIPQKQLEFLFDLFEINKDLLIEYENRKINNPDDLLEGKCLLSVPIILKELDLLKKNNNYSNNQNEIKSFYENELIKQSLGKYRWSRNNNAYSKNLNLPYKKIFNGKIIIIINSKTASLGEGLFYIIRDDLKYKNVVIVGENSRGCISYANPHQYYLKNSGICLSLTSRTNFFDNDKYCKKYIEGRGVIPDYWTTNDTELIETIKYLCCN